MRPKEKIYRIDKSELEALQVVPESNSVMVRVPYYNRHQKTSSGLFIVGDEDYKPATHAERWGYVYKVCSKLFYDPPLINSMQWETEVEIQEGDEVWFNFNMALHAYTYICDNEIYKMLKYQDLYVARRGKEVIPLNGYVVLKEWKPPKKSVFLLEEKADKRFAVVEHYGSCNKEYSNSHYSDDIQLGVGDRVLLEEGTSLIPLEGGLHNTFRDDQVFIQQRKRILAVVDSDSNVVRVNSNTLAVKVKKSSLLKAGVVLMRDYKNYRIGEVKAAYCPDIPMGSTVVIPLVKGAELNDLEYITHEKILYYETSS